MAYLISFSIVDTSGEKYFDLLTTDLMDDSMKLVDAKGRDIAYFRMERFGPGKRAHITIKKDGEDSPHIYNLMSLYIQDSCPRSPKVRVKFIFLFIDFPLFAWFIC